MKFDSIPELIDDIQNGKMVILVDDENRENEGDIILAADHVDPSKVNFMASQAKGLICLALGRQQIQRLGLPLMIRDDLNESPNRTAFTVSIEAADGVTTGISAADRAHTIKVASHPEATAKDITVPGHIFPIRAQEGGVLKRAGHTEASVDLSILAGLNPAAVICEIMNQDGTMARAPELFKFAKEHDLKIGTIEDLIHYRIEHDTFVEKKEEAPFINDKGERFAVHVFQNKLDGREHLAFVSGILSPNEPVLVRVQTENVLGDVFSGVLGSSRDSITKAMSQISQSPGGVLLYLRMENMEERLVNRVKAYQQAFEGTQGTDTRVFRSDRRDYGVGAQILRSLGVRKIKLLSNSPSRLVGLKGYGLEIVETLQIQGTQENSFGIDSEEGL